MTLIYLIPFIKKTFYRNVVLCKFVYLPNHNFNNFVSATFTELKYYSSK